MAGAKCPLCGEVHELFTAKNGTSFVRCSTWSQKVFFNEGSPKRYLKKVFVADFEGPGLDEGEEEIELE